MAGSHAWPKKVMSLASGKPPSGPRHKGFLGSLRDNSIVPIAFSTGLVLSVSIIPFTVFLSHQQYQCPWWAYDCTVFTHRSGTIQGLVTLIYTIGLTCLAYACWALAEMSLWPLLCLQPLTLQQIDTYLAVSRGSIPSIPPALAMVRKYNTLLFITWAFIATLTTLSAGPVVGYVLDQPSLPTSYVGEIFVGGGGGDAAYFTQTNPPDVFNSVVAGFFTLWSSGFPINESMPTYGDWIIDRETLASRGNFTAKAVRVQKSVSCNGMRLNQTNATTSSQLIHKARELYFNTSIASAINGYRPTGGQSLDYVAVDNVARISVWAHDISFVSVNRTITKLVFALPGYVIEDSYTTNLTGYPSTIFPFISAIACDVDIELIDDVLIVGDGGNSLPKPGQQPHSELPVLSSINELQSWQPEGQHPDLAGGHQELALLFSVAPIMCGNSFAGLQPYFGPYSNESRILLSTLSVGTNPNYQWTLDQIMRLINVSTSAYLLASSLQYRERQVLMDFTVFANRMSPIRNVLLAAPVTIMLVTWGLLAVWTSRLHERCKMPYMRMGETAEILRAYQTAGMTDIDEDVAEEEDGPLHCHVTEAGNLRLRSDGTMRDIAKV